MLMIFFKKKFCGTIRKIVLTSTFKCCGSTAAVLVKTWNNQELKAFLLTKMNHVIY